jgi:predicted nucleic-acid-binding protein
MIGIDTNVLIRYLTQDDPLQSPLANDLIDRRLSQQEPGFIRLVAMVETVWVLDRAFGVPGAELVSIIERLLQADNLVIEDEREVFLAMAALKDGRGGFADALIGALGRRAGCSHTVTFDRKALRVPEFDVI